MKRAFTLIEMLVSVSVLLVLAAIILFGSNRGAQGYDLLNAANRLETELRKTQGFAVATREVGAPPAPPAGGWGIYLNRTQNSYVIFADTIVTPASANGRFNAPTEEVERIFLPASVTIASIVGGATPNELAIVYRAPLLAVLFDGVSAATPAVITFQNKIGQTKTVTINAVGNVSVQ